MVETNQDGGFNEEDLPSNERTLLNSIRDKKKQLIDEIQELRREIEEVTSELEAMDIEDENKPDPKAKQISIGKKKFNMDPKKVYTACILTFSEIGLMGSLKGLT
ncbi:hypothetical protein LOTGIDRAFT_156661 [Lottia gigantea]|uniref:Uncharacterized protein n=1 Tax=Lottia gigantea TaxID=225164 RepID=V4B9I0_LOTGI|nr:hypothetical protein LOTGIDRAFT_156661 [Lottia gigantea]ESP04051.1 hypothetical protein LOTGIDRAFT_156661 [Lottia gigantea]